MSGIEEVVKTVEFLDSEIARLQEERRLALVDLEDHVFGNGPFEILGYVGRFKRGRASVDHEKAARDSKSDRLPELIEKHTSPNPTTSWSKITKALGIDTDPYKTPGDLVFVFQKAKSQT